MPVAASMLSAATSTSAPGCCLQFRRERARGMERETIEELAQFGQPQQEELMSRQEQLRHANDHLIQSSHSILEAQVIILIIFGNGNKKGSGKKRKDGSSGDSNKHESKCKKGLRPVLWLTPGLPLKMDELIILLDVLASKVKAIRRLRELLTPSCLQAHFRSSKRSWSVLCTVYDSAINQSIAVFGKI